MYDRQHRRPHHAEQLRQIIQHDPTGVSDGGRGVTAHMTHAAVVTPTALGDGLHGFLSFTRVHLTSRTTNRDELKLEEKQVSEHSKLINRYKLI